MEACSLLLGRLWDFDNDAIHHGRSNTYTFMHKGKKITMVPIWPLQKLYKLIDNELLVCVILNLKISKLLIQFTHLKRTNWHLLIRPRELNWPSVLEVRARHAWPCVGVFPPGVTPTSKTCVRAPFSRWWCKKTQRFILVRAREGPTSSGGGVFVLFCT